MSPRRQATPEERERGQRLARALVRRRQERSLTVEQLARQADLTRDTIAKIERGPTVNPGFFTVAAIAHVLDAGLDQLVAESET